MTLTMNSSPDSNPFEFQAMDVDDVASRIEVMRIQEENGYRCVDYLHQQEPLPDHNRTGPQEEECRMSSLYKRVDEECRVKMSEWCYQVVDFCKFNRETVGIAMSYLDRYLMTESGVPALADRKVFQLAAMTALYMAVKLFEPEVMEPRIVSGLSRGSYTEEEITSMEMKMLAALNWRVQPPTSLSFVQHFLALLPAEVGISERQAIVDCARFQTELAVNDYYFVDVVPSTIAVASILNAIEVSGHVSLPASTRWLFLHTLTKAASIDLFSTEMTEAQGRLMDALRQNYGSGISSLLESSPTSVSSVPSKEKTTGDASPRSVARNNSERIIHGIAA